MEAETKEKQADPDLSVVDGGKPVQVRESDGVRRELVALSKQISTSYFNFAALLQRAFETRMYDDWGHKTWKDFVELELHISIRKAQYLMRIHHWFVTVLKDETIIQRVKHLGWTKVGKLVGVVDEENVDEWVERAEEMTVGQLEDYIKQLRGGKDPHKSGSEDIKTVAFKLYPAQLENVEDAIELAARITDSEDEPKRGHLLDLICTTFRTDHVFQTKPGDKLLKHYLMKLAAIADVTLIATERGSGELIVGTPTALRKAVLAAPEKTRADILRALEGKPPAPPSKPKLSA